MDDVGKNNNPDFFSIFTSVRFEGRFLVDRLTFSLISNVLKVDSLNDMCGQ